MSKPDIPPDNGGGSCRVDDVAAEWYARNDRGLTDGEAAEFARWCDEAPEHRAAYADIERTWSAMSTLQQLRTGGVPDADLLRTGPSLEALPEAQDETGDKVRPPQAARTARAPWWPWLAAAAAIVVFLTMWPRFGREAEVAAVDTYRSVVGGREVVTLQDGSTVELNTNSLVEARFTRAERRVRLLKGEALFSVKKDASRPFIVTDDRVAVRAIGTAFDVRRREATLDVWVTEGRVSIVAVAGELTGLGTATLGMGERAVIDTEGRNGVRVSRVTPEEMERMLAWQEGMLDFRGAPLSEVLDEMNRYHSVALRAADGATASIVVGGSFRSDNLEAFLRVLDAGFGVTVESRTPDAIVLRRTREL